MNARTRTTHCDPSRAPAGMCERAPLCDAALATNTELRREVGRLREALEGRERGSSLRSRLTAAERELVEHRDSPWTFLPWRGFVS